MSRERRERPEDDRVKKRNFSIDKVGSRTCK